jgi:anti-anti-sigma factor
LVVLEPAAEGMCVRCRGELDLATVDQLEREVRRVVASGCRAVTLDLRELGIFDCSGLRLLMRLKHDAAIEGWTLNVRHAGGMVGRLLELTYTEDWLAGCA